MVDIPRIDFSGYMAGDTAAEDRLATAVETALGQTGFMTVSNIGVEPAAIDRVFATSQQFFTQADAFKEQFRYRSAAENFGYQEVGMESLEPGKPGDLKETFTLRLNDNTRLAAERWPPGDFRATVSDFYADCEAAARRIMQVMAKIFDLAPDYFGRTVTGENMALRLLHYPAHQASDPAGEQLGAGAHTDYGILTLLFQRDVGGLEVRDSEGNWQEVPCVPGAVVINTGDLVQQWTNGRFRSTEHRVKPMTGVRDRYSVAFFVDPDSDTLVEPLPQCVDADNPPRFEPITAGEHIRQKLEKTHNL